MIKISSVVRAITYSSEIALSALSDGYLNLSAYAKFIKEDVEKKTKKTVKVGSITVALSRLGRSLKKTAPLLPKVIAEDISVKSGLAEIVFDKIKDTFTKTHVLYRDKELSSTDFFVITHGVGEITIIALEKVKSHILRIYRPQKPKIIVENLVGLTVRLKEEYIYTPNVIYTLVRSLALKRVNIVEIVSTYTELTFVLQRDNLQTAFLIFNEIFKRTNF